MTLTRTKWMSRGTKKLTAKKQLRSKQPLKAGAPPQRRTPLAQVGKKKRAETAAVVAEAVKPVRPVWSTLTARPRPAVPASKRKRLYVRTGDGSCEMQLRVAGCTWWAAEASHRDARGMGGRFGEALEVNNRLSNLVYACAACHRYCHLFPAFAEGLGLFIEGDQDDPAEVEVYRRGRRVRLCDHGRSCSEGEVHDLGPWHEGADADLDDEGQVAA